MKPRTHHSQSVEAAIPGTWRDAAELAAMRPTLLVGLGATAAQALLGRTFRVTKHRGDVLERDGRPILPTVHPSARLRERDARQAAMHGIITDLERAREALTAAASHA
jgi:DNA polymerase